MPKKNILNIVQMQQLETLRYVQKEIYCKQENRLIVLKKINPTLEEIGRLYGEPETQTDRDFDKFLNPSKYGLMSWKERWGL